MGEFSVAIVIPALDEERALARVLAEIPELLVDRVVVVDNGSTDRTADVARAAGAEVVEEARRGYGGACQAGLRHLAADPPDVVVILDADHSDYPQDLPELLAPIERGAADLVCGSRLQRAEPGALGFNVVWGNALATWLIHVLYRFRYRDMGPFRAIRWPALQRLDMRDRAYGWNAEMQVKALLCGLRVEEVPVRYRRRTGQSKISGTVRGTLRAGAAILGTILSLRLRRRDRQSEPAGERDR